MARTNEHGGIDYGIVRTADEVWLADDDGDGRNPEWVADEEDATVWPTREQAETFALLAGVAQETDTGIELDDHVDIREVHWINEEDIEPDDLDRELDEEEHGN